MGNKHRDLLLCFNYDKPNKKFDSCGYWLITVVISHRIIVKTVTTQTTSDLESLYRDQNTEQNLQMSLHLNLSQNNKCKRALMETMTIS